MQRAVGFLPSSWAGGRAVEGGALLKRYTGLQYRGFESRSAHAVKVLCRGLGGVGGGHIAQ